MTGLLSVFSLLPVQPLKKEDSGDGEAEDNGDPGGSAKADEHKLSSQDDEDSSDKEAERYLCIHTFSDAQFVFMITCWLSAAHIFIYPVVHMWTPLQFFLWV